MAQDPRALLQKAEQAKARATGAWVNKAEKWEQAIDAYTRAANAFRMLPAEGDAANAAAAIEAGKAFETIAWIQKFKQEDEDDAANTYLEAYKVYKKADPQNAAKCLTIAIERYTSKGNFRRAATHQQHLAELYESNLGDKGMAMKSYELAASWFENDNATALANKLWLKVADLAAIEQDYYKAIELYEKVAAEYCSNHLLKWSAKDCFLKAGLCHLAVGDQVATNRALEKYRDMDPSFPREREHQFLCDIYESVEAGDQEMFENKAFLWNQMKAIDSWQEAVLKKIKLGIEDQGEDFS